MEEVDGVVMGMSCGEPACIFAPARPGGRFAWLRRHLLTLPPSRGGRPRRGQDQGNRMQARELREADAALYAAKQAGRDRVGRATAEPALA